MTDESKVYILDTYNPYNVSGNVNVKKIFKHYDHYYCVREVELEWGRPVLNFRSITDDDEFLDFHLYDSLDEAKAAVAALKRCE